MDKGVIVVEDLNVSGMTANQCLAKAIQLLKYQPEYQKSVNVIDSTLPKFTSTLENFDSGIAVSVVCLSLILSAFIRFLN